MPEEHKIAFIRPGARVRVLAVEGEHPAFEGVVECITIAARHMTYGIRSEQLKFGAGVIGLPPEHVEAIDIRDVLFTANWTGPIQYPVAVGGGVFVPPMPPPTAKLEVSRANGPLLMHPDVLAMVYSATGPTEDAQAEPAPPPTAEPEGSWMTRPRLFS